ncbi:MAG: DNA polymerase III subunit gamma/tau [Flavobacterium sp.]
MPTVELEVDAPEEVVPPASSKPEPEGTVKVSALSLSSIKKMRELAEMQKSQHKHADELPTEPFTETDMLLNWNKFAQRLSDSGQKIMATYMQMNDPVLEGTTIKLQMPNEGSKVDFDNGKLELLGYLRGKLHNHDIVIETFVNESTERKYAFTPEEKYEKLKAINPAMEILRKMFDLDI